MNDLTDACNDFWAVNGFAGRLFDHITLAVAFAALVN